MTAAIDLAGRTALVTGAAGGIGRAIVARLSAAGAHVIASDLAADPPAGLGAASYARLDVTDQADWRDLVAAIDRDHGALDILVHNAGRVLVTSVEATTAEAWRALFAVNVDGAFLGTRALLPLLRKGANRREAGASIVLLSSIAGLGGAARMTAYCATKGAIRLFAKACAMEFAPDRIRVNSVHPGGVDTPMMAEIAEAVVAHGRAPSAEAALAGYAAAHPLGRLVAPDEIARAVRFLASDEAAYMTGSELVVDGGFTAH